MAGKTEIRRGVLALRGSPLGPPAPGRGENPQPLFRDPRGDLPTAEAEGFPADKRPGYGRETAFRLLPYTLQDRYGRNLEDLEFPLLILENEFLRAEVVPSLGGRLWALFDKKEGRDILYRNPLFRPANLAIRDAWFSGGIEWNIGRLGHTVHTCSPVFAGRLASGEGPPALRLWEFERQTRLFWRIDLTLPPDSPALFAYFRVENPDPEGKPLYWWTNAAVSQTEGLAPGAAFPGARVLSAASEVLYSVPGTVKTLGGAALPELPTLPGLDASYPLVSDYSNEFFFQNDRARREGGLYPWEAAVAEDGYAYGEASTAPLLYRKMFCWGRGPGGRRWQDYLSLPGERYLEVQAGLAPTQLHTADIPGRGTVDWAQGFTGLRADPAAAHCRDYRAAAAHLEALLRGRIPPPALKGVLEAGRARAALPPAEVLALGSGWGALERRLAAAAGADLPPGLPFPDESIGEGEKPWLALIDDGALPPRSLEDGPGSFVIHRDWEVLLRKSLERGGNGAGDWLTPYHLGVIALERGEIPLARSYWEQSLGARENPWTSRNLAVAALREGDVPGALDHYRRAFEGSCGGETERSFAEEYVSLLMDAAGADEAAAVLDRIAASGGGPEALSGPLTDALARIAFARGDDALLDRIFSREPAHIREGDATLADLWTARELRRLGEQEGMRPSRAEGRLPPPPREIDFRMFPPGGGSEDPVTLRS
jgi:hypothetical protein